MNSVKPEAHNLSVQQSRKLNSINSKFHIISGYAKLSISSNRIDKTILHRLSNIINSQLGGSIHIAPTCDNALRGVSKVS